MVRGRRGNDGCGDGGVAVTQHIFARGVQKRDPEVAEWTYPRSGFMYFAERWNI
jgi:hypothetical protein